MAKPTIAGTALELLRTRRVATAEEITEVVVARGLTRAKDPLRAVRGALDASPRLQQLDDGRWASLEILLDGATLTHELTTAEATAGALAVEADVVGVWMVRYGRSLPDGGELDGLIFEEARRRVGRDCHRALAGPEGWLPATPGTFLHLRIDDEMLHVEPGPRPRAGARTAERRIADVARACIEGAVFSEEDGVVDVTRVLLHALVDAPDLLAEPIRPLGEVLRDAGLEVFESLVGTAGTDWRGRGWAAWASLGIEDDDDEEDGFGEDDEDEDDPGSAPDPSREVEQLRERYDLDDVQVRLLEFVFAALLLERLEEPLTDETSMQAVATALRDPLLAVIVSDRVIGDPAVGSLLRRVVETAEPERTAGAWHVLGVAVDMDGDPDAAEAHLRAALRIDRDFWPAMGMLSRLAEERGDLVEALRLVVRAGVPPDDPARERLASAVAPVGPKVGRNDPCPCGSGRKSKVCHPDGVGAITLSPARRLRWILGVWGERPDVHLTTHEILAEAGIRADHDIPVGSEDDSPDGDARWMMCHTLAADIALFDEGHLADLLRVRGHRLPPDLLPLARTWLETSRSIVEVRAVAPDRGVTVRDLADGVVGELDDRVLARQVKPLDLLCARLLSDGGGGWIVNDAFRVPRGQRERVTAIVREGDGVELLEWLDDPSPPLHLRTPEGDELVRVRSTWVVPGDEAARTRLARLPEVRSDDPDHYTLVQPIDDRDSIVGTITFTGDEATLEAMSQGRARRLGVLLRSVAPRARVMRSSRQSATAMLREARTMEPIPAPDLGPEADAFLDEFMQQQERRWVDESIPALGGLTPRQALEDPVGRPRLDALLDDFAWQERQEMVGLQRPNTGGMQVRRTRALLGIGPGPGLD